MYMADLFDKSHDISDEKRIEMISSWLKNLDELADISVCIDVSEIS